MTSPIVEVVLGPEGFEYIERRLAWGLGLSRRVLAEVQTRSGSVRTWVPEETSPQTLAAFKRGGLLPVDENDRHPQFANMVRVPNLDGHLTGIIDRFLNARPDTVAIFEDAVASPRDAFLERVQSRVVRTDTEIYYVLGHDDRRAGLLEESLSDGRSTPEFVIVLSAGPAAAAAAAAARQTFEPRHLDDLAQCCEAIVCGAYDGEGFVLWQRAARSGDVE